MPNLSELLYYSGETSMQLIVWSLFIGVVIAAIAGYFIKLKFGTFVRKLLENDINSPEKAATLEELGLQKKLFIKLGLKSHTNYKNMIVAITEDGKFYANNTYTDVVPEFKEFVVVKRKRGRDAIKEAPKDETESAPLSGLAKVLQSKEKTAAEKTVKTENEIFIAVSDSEKDKSTEGHDISDIKTTESNIETNAQNTENTSTDSSAAPDISESLKYTDFPKERVKFDITKARYYIPPEIHDRAYSLYHTKSGKTNSVVLIIILLVALALLATFSGSLISGFTDFLKGIKNPFSKPTL